MNKLLILHNRVWKFNDELVDTHFESETSQFFETTKENFIFRKDTKKLYKVTADHYFNVLIKLVNLTSVLKPLRYTYNINN